MNTHHPLRSHLLRRVYGAARASCDSSLPHTPFFGNTSICLVIPSSLAVQSHLTFAVFPSDCLYSHAAAQSRQQAASAMALSSGQLARSSKSVSCRAMQSRSGAPTYTGAHDDSALLCERGLPPLPSSSVPAGGSDGCVVVTIGDCINYLLLRDAVAASVAAASATPARQRGASGVWCGGAKKRRHHHLNRRQWPLLTTQSPAALQHHHLLRVVK